MLWVGGKVCAILLYITNNRNIFVVITGGDDYDVFDEGPYFCLIFLNGASGTVVV